MNISDFKKGDKITRVEPTHTIGDKSYIGWCFILVGVANGCIYYFDGNDMGNSDHMRNLPLNDWEDGWEYYIDPDSLIDDAFLNNVDIKIIEKYLRKKKLIKIQ